MVCGERWLQSGSLNTLSSFRAEVIQHFSPHVPMCPVRMRGLPSSGSVLLSFNLCVKGAATLRGWLCPCWNKELCRSCLRLPAFSSNCLSLIPLTAEPRICNNTHMVLSAGRTIGNFFLIFSIDCQVSLSTMISIIFKKRLQFSLNPQYLFELP